MKEFYNITNSKYIEICKKPVISERVKVELLDSYDNAIGEITTSISSTDGNINIKYAQGVRRTCSLTVYDYNKNLIPNNEFSPFFINKKFKVYIGLYDENNNFYKDDVIFWFSQGIFIVNDCSYDLINRTLTLSGVDKFGFFTKELNQHNLQNAYRITAGSKLGTTISDMITLDMGNGTPTDCKTPIIDTKLFDQEIPCDIEKTANETIGDILIETANVFNADIYYNAEGNLVLEQSVVDDYNRLAPLYTASDGEISNLNLNYDYTNIKNQVTVTGNNSDGKVYSFTAKNENPMSSLRISNIGVKAGDVEETAMGYSEKRCMDYAEYLLKKEMMVATSGNVSIAPLPHLDVNKIFETLEEKYVINEVNVPLNPDSYNISISNIRELPLKASLSDGIEPPPPTEWILYQNSSSLGKVNNVNGYTKLTTPKTVNGVTVTAIGLPVSSTSAPLTTGETISYSVTGLSGVETLCLSDGIKSINHHAFYQCSSLISIIIPDSVTSIGYCAFYECSNLENVAIPDSVTSIGSEAFFFCESLTNVNIPDSVTLINWGTFQGCKSLTSMTIPDGVASIGSWAFSACESLTSMTIPDSVTSIDYCAFVGCKSLTSIIVPDSVIEIGEGLFCNCSALKTVELPNNITSLAMYQTFGFYGGFFSGCTSLESIIIPDSVTLIDDYAFNECSSLANITIPDNVTKLGTRAFYKCSSLTEAIIGNSVTLIGGSAFEGCTSLTDVTIDNSVTSIYYSAFYNCTNLAHIYFTGTEEQWNAISKGSDWNKNMGSSVSGGTQIHYNYTP